MASEVVRGLWQGDQRDAEGALRQTALELAQGHVLSYDLLVLCAEEAQFRVVLQPTLAVWRVPLRDVVEPLSRHARRRALEAARRVAHAVTQHQRVLTSCAAGWNRSGLVNALALRLLGLRADEAVALVRRARGPQALSNPSFERLVHLLSQEELRYG